MHRGAPIAKTDRAHPGRIAGRKKSWRSFIFRVSVVYITVKCFDIALGLDCTGNTCRRIPLWHDGSFIIHRRFLLSTLSFLCRLSYIDRSYVTGVKFAKRCIDRALHHRPLFHRAANKLIVRHNVSGVDGAFVLKREDACRRARGTNAHYTTLFIAFCSRVGEGGRRMQRRGISRTGRTRDKQVRKRGNANFAVGNL